MRGFEPHSAQNWLCVSVPDKNNTHEEMEEHIPIIGADYLTNINIWAMISYELNNRSECFTILSEDWGLNILGIYYILHTAFLIK